MRRNSPKQSAASRKNGSKGKGPTSSSGKKVVRLNALKDGLFTKEIVVESAGERQEDFDRLEKQIWDYFQPEDSLQAMLVTDFIENRWRLQRVRRAESAELKNRFAASRVMDLLTPPDELQSLHARFLNRCKKYSLESSSKDPRAPLDALATADELEEIRRQLASTFWGVTFLIERMTMLEKIAQSNGYVSAENADVILACCGFGDEAARRCFQLNFVNMELFGKSAANKKSGASKKDRTQKYDEEMTRLARMLGTGEEGSPSDEAPKENAAASEPDPESSRQMSILSG